MRCLLPLALLPAEPTLKSSPAVELTFKTEPGKFHQLQVKKGDAWVDLGPAVTGTGKSHSIFQTVYRDAHTTTDGKTQPYSSARLRTQRRGDWKFGRFEIRAKVPDGQGIWPAVWMMPTDSKYGGWAAGGEIDIVESRGSKVGETLSALHFGGFWPNNVHVDQTYKFPGRNAAQDFHTYALESSKDEISWFVDGVKWKTRKKNEWWSDSARGNPSAPYDQPFHLIMNVAVDGRFFENEDQKADRLPASAFPQVMQVEFVRVYQWAE